MRRFRKVITVLALGLVIVVALVAGGLATSLFIAFGSGKSMSVKGPLINVPELQVCEVVLIDLDRLDITLPSLLALLPNPLEQINVTLSPEIDFTAGLLPRKSVDSAILGFDTCIASLELNSWSVIHSALGEPWFEFGERIEFAPAGTGTSISFDVAQASNSTLIISITDLDPPIQQIALNAELSFPYSNVWIISLAVTSGTLLVLFVLPVVLYIVNTRKGSQL